MPGSASYILLTTTKLHTHKNHYSIAFSSAKAWVSVKLLSLPGVGTKGADYATPSIPATFVEQLTLRNAISKATRMRRRERDVLRSCHWCNYATVSINHMRRKRISHSQWGTNVEAFELLEEINFLILEVKKLP